jgi:salicylate hydroxylase
VPCTCSAYTFTGFKRRDIRKGSVTELRVAVVGAGIGGLATTLALRQQGLEAHAYEQAPALGEIGAGVAVGPNGLRALRWLGLGEAVQSFGTRWDDTRYLRSDGADIGPMLTKGMEQYGLHRADLLEMLAREVPADAIHTGFQASSFEQDQHQARVLFTNGEIATADLVIAADGIHSVLQTFVVPPARPVFSNTMAYRGVLPAASVDWKPGVVRNWLGFGKHFLAYGVRRNELLNWVAFVPTDQAMKESWSAPGDPEALAAEYAGWDPELQRIIDQVRVTFRWGLYDREPLPRWTNGRLALLGDAAHAMLPHAGQGANQASEDAVALAIVLGGADPDTVMDRLQLYERLRRERTARVQALSRARGNMKSSASEDRSTRDLGRAAEAADYGDWLRDYDVVSSVEAALAG